MPAAIIADVRNDFIQTIYADLNDGVVERLRTSSIATGRFTG